MQIPCWIAVNIGGVSKCNYQPAAGGLLHY